MERQIRKHIIITNGRSGSNYFVQMLNQHPEVVNYGEVFGDWTLAGRYVLPHFRKRGGAYLEWLYQNRHFFRAAQIHSYVKRHRNKERPHFRRWKNVTTLGMKEFIVNLQKFDLIDSVCADPEMKIITLVRKNALERHVSGMLMRKTGVIAQTGTTDKKPDTVSLDPTKILKSMEVYTKQQDAVEAIATMAPASRVFPLTYEDYFSLDEVEKRHVEHALLDFLGVEAIDLPADHKKIRQANLAETIENFEEIRAVLNGTPYEKYL